mgnify:CR=1 FL=1
MKRLAKVISLLRPSAAKRSPVERLVHTKIDGKTYSISSDDDYLDHVEGAFEPEMVSFFKSLLQPTDTVLDIGANIGCTSLLFGDLASKVYSFEPSPTTHRWLVENVQRAELSNVEPINLGLGKDARNLHDQDAAYHVMYRHILHGSSYPTLVGAFRPTQLNALSSTFGIQLAGRAEMKR